MAEPKFTVYIRLPIPRGDFVDPPPITWDFSKDDELWGIISGAAKTEIDWNELALHFNVTVSFLLQQVAYLTERHHEQLRAQVRKATAAAKGAPSPVPGAEPSLGHGRTASALSIRRDSPLPGSAGPPTPINTSLRPNISRTASSGTAVNVAGSSSPRPAIASLRDGVNARRRLSSLPIESTPRSPELSSPTHEESDSYDSSDSESLPAQSRIIRRPPRFQAQRLPTDGPGDLGDDEEETDTEPAFAQRQSNSTGAGSAQSDLTSTLRGEAKSGSRRGPSKGKEKAVQRSETSDSSVPSSPAFASRPSGPSTSGDKRPHGPLSPRRTTELSGKSPRREGSDGTPSMGSSFSDLDDASVTQSALEEALASKMQDGAGSRFSISQAFRSRYIPKGSQR
ncbi:hypothetical protein F5X68DRAFT_261878 [Plectosphaerella plurivora]|uniref:Autophagy-related protein 29 n=1 Tax=Plectosphaerella plurivora TaxID=936078 RepID=A0A9P8VC85_9PEZI|nr:hypothetical protein F5X68DRAFT_261878 [Plectosphaerella plurivora]